MGPGAGWDGPVSSRSYLSIGDVLTLLRQEFPDVTISKIRFLESQGLVNPERTPSGYRKFYEHDVERLRWVLRQQREHFLPLKVIKDRLDEDNASSGGGSAAGTGDAPDRHADPVAPPPPPPSEDAVGEPAPALVGHSVSADSVSADSGSADSGDPATGVPGGGDAEGSTLIAASAAAANHQADDPRAGVAARASHGMTNGSLPVPPPERTPAVTASPGVPVVDSAALPGLVGTEPTAAASDGTSQPRATASRRQRSTKAAVPSDPVSVPAATPTPASPSARVTPPTGGGAGGGGVAGPPVGAVSVPADLSGASLSREELAAASGLDAAVIDELQSYGLLVPTTVAGLEHFDEDALAVAVLAAGFARFGVEPRHLRLYKNAADRETGFVEQIVLPLVRQRNPEARVRARQTADELAELGQRLRGALLRRALGDLLNG